MGDCCKLCCYSTPYASIVALAVATVGLVGFLCSAVHGVVQLSSSELLGNYTIVLAPVVGGVAGTTALTLLLVTALAYCATGFIRDELYHPCVKACVGPFCSVWVIGLTFMFCVVWLLMVTVLSFMATIYLQLRFGCDSVDYSSSAGECFSVAFEPFSHFSICGDETGENLLMLCNGGLRIGISFVISWGFSLVVVLGLVLILMVQTANFAFVKENRGRSYHPDSNC